MRRLDRLDSTIAMIRKRFLLEPDRQRLLAVARDASEVHGLARRANAVILLDKGMSCDDVADVLLLDDDTVRRWHKVFAADGVEALLSFGYEGSECRLSEPQQAALKAWVSKTLPRSSVTGAKVWALALFRRSAFAA